MLWWRWRLAFIRFWRLWRFWRFRRTLWFRFLVFLLWLFRTWFRNRLFNFLIFFFFWFFISFLILIRAFNLIRVWRFYMTWLWNLAWFLISVSRIRRRLRYRFFYFFFLILFWSLFMWIVSCIWGRNLWWRIIARGFLWNFSFTCIITLSNLRFFINLRTLLFRNSIWLALNLLWNCFLVFRWNFFLFRFSQIFLWYRIFLLIRIPALRFWLHIVVL